MTSATDSDNDTGFTLRVVDGHGARVITSALHDETDVRDLGEWLAVRTGSPLTLPRGMGARPRSACPPHGAVNTSRETTRGRKTRRVSGLPANVPQPG